ncbi:CAP domain-containing protein [Nitrospirota bacterium]
MINFRKTGILCIVIFLTLFIISNVSAGRKKSQPDCNTKKAELSKQEKKLHKIINKYRKGKGLPNIPLSPSLICVAQTHARDLMKNNPVKGKCNLHSWSGKGSWSACCYTDDHAAAQCMWDKPRELSSYDGNGYEIAHATYGANATAASGLKSWKSSKGHNAVMINEGIWEQVEWHSIGVGIYKNYAVVWFGQEPDTSKQ